jgi:hypothetical protein
LPTTSRRPRSPKKVILRSGGSRKNLHRPVRATKPAAISAGALPIDWIRPLAEPYLRGYRAKPERVKGLRGFSFSLKPSRARGSLGFFVGYLIEPGAFAHLKPAAPECLIFAFVEPIGGPVHRAQVRDANGTLRWTSGYIRWLTHRPPRFEFFESERTALIRHASICTWPAEKIQHFAGNFFTETLAWLVRSGLVRRWRELSVAGAK